MWQDWNFNYQSSYPITGTNIVFSPHRYGGDGKNPYGSEVSQIRAEMADEYSMLQKGYCVLNSEYGGIQNAVDCNNAYSVGWIKNFLPICDQDGYAGYFSFGWNPMPNWMPIVQDWYGTPTDAGQVIKDYYTSSTPTPVVLPYHENFTDLSKWQKINGTWTPT